MRDVDIVNVGLFCSQHRPKSNKIVIDFEEINKVNARPTSTEADTPNG